MTAAEDPSKKYDQAFFLDLAMKGKDAWNAWRRDPANKDVHVTFAGIDFSEAPRDEIDFSGFEFGDHADFSRCNWQRRRRGYELINVLNNPKAFTPGRAFFVSAVFGRQASFTGTAFGDEANFADAVFGDLAYFAGAAFGWHANFTAAAFGDWLLFPGAAFGQVAYFDDAIFKGRASFDGQSEEEWARDLEESVPDKGAEPFKTLKERLEKGHTESGSRPDRFLNISFAGAHFYGEAGFRGRLFAEAADFSNARFYSPPDFDATTNLTRIDFTGAHVGFVLPGRFLHWTSETAVPVRLRAFRKIAEDTNNHDLERDLYIEERKAGRGVYLRQQFEELKRALKKGQIIELPRIIGRLMVHVFWIFVMFFYWALADYGRSFARPAVWLVSSGFFFYWCYTEVLAQLVAKAPDIEKYKQAVTMLALGNTVPFVGPLTIDSKVKEFLFCPYRKCPDPLVPPEGYQWLVLGQNLFSITCVFFIGLALRNYFRIK